MILDVMDRKILSILQVDATLSISEIADRVSLSPTPCWKRIKRLERDGVIERRVNILSRAALGLGVTVMVAVRTTQHTEEWLASFAEGVSQIPEVIEFFRMSGEIDYLLKVVARDIDDYDRIYRKLTCIVALRDVSSSFVMQVIKTTTELPLY
ncbi:AsnC family transcriptional regulator [Novosphingobium sp. Rr 2-17]|uniref:Lrp/AsnC family transcriptional regulator n=1 Tax=Novosphingobium sp. Rr 2-17 TaxID=555793 RepID=UPI0002697E90|nr:Lrp/AsnC family transcriptional regulator [Novosphingobium sp. Rr 2-17]EIZ80108.1 AsnC family transcriptional regulator [Novosphingobium sp. Rr 2-17]